jgi:uncharacterized protein
MNRLAQERSAYLRHAADQEIDWYPWSEEAFEKALREDKPVFLSSGAVWCHWCHVMAKESFGDAETARLLNENFVSIKLDRDERPDLDRRLQQAVAAMGSGSGWPLSVFLTPGRKVFYGGTYFPPEDRQGRPGFRKVLQAVVLHYRTRKEDIRSYASSLETALRPEPLEKEALTPDILDQAEAVFLSQFDGRNGGFGGAPKFPMPGALEFLLRRFSQGHQTAGEAARTTLFAMARGGMHDQLAGGFHRYSVDDSWTVPHFEKMADDNAGLIRNFVEAYQLFGEDRFREVAESIIAFIRSELAERSGGFYASQDADVTPDDEGGYFTWTDQELREALSREEYEVLSLHLVRSDGSLHHDPSKKVLAMNHDVAEIASRTGTPPSSVLETLGRAKAALLARRQARQAPFIDRTLYTSLNGMLIAAFFRASQSLADRPLAAFAARSLDRILEKRFQHGKLYHAEDVPAMLEDYVHLIDAALSGYEATGTQHYLELAEKLMTLCKTALLDREEGGFFDTDREVLGVRMKRIEDSPHPSPNAVAIQLLLRLGFVTGKDEYRQEAEQCLRAFSGPASSMGVHGGTFFCGLHLWYHSATLTIEAAPDSPLADAARSAAIRSYSLLRYGPDSNRVVACVNGVCSAPVTEPSALAGTVQQGG